MIKYCNWKEGNTRGSENPKIRGDKREMLNDGTGKKIHKL